MRIPLGDFRRAVEEQAALCGGTVDNVYQCDPRTFLLRIKVGREKVPYLVTLGRGAARALVPAEPPAVPDAPPVFGMILRKALRGGRLTDVSMPREDRIVVLEFEVAGKTRKLVIEAMPRFGNLLLLDEAGRVERVLDGAAARHRGNPVGSAYTLPDDPGFPADPSVLPDPLEPGSFAANHALDRLFRAEIGDAAGEAAEAAAARDVEKVLQRLRRTRGAVERDLRDLPDAARLRAQGEELLCNYAQLTSGARKFKGIPLDPKLSPQENVERIFEKARKADRARPVLQSRLADLDALIERAEAGEGIPARLIPAKKSKSRAQAPRLPYRTFTSADGHRILAGKGGKDNDETTLRVASPHDLFLHVRGVPGSHVIIPLGRGEEVKQETLLDAATLALHYSKARAAASAEITYTLRKFVHKPRGAKPGLVQVQREKVLRLRREPERLARLLMTAGGTDAK